MSIDDHKSIEFTEFINNVLDESGKIALKYFRQIRDLSLKGDLSPVTLADQEIEEFIRARINEFILNIILLEKSLKIIELHHNILGTLIQSMELEALLLESMISEP